MALFGIFGGGGEKHPLADPKQAEAVLAGVAGKPPGAVVADMGSWLESLLRSDGLGPARRLELALAIDEAAAAYARRHVRDYLNASRNRSQEYALWNLGESYWTHAVAVYELCIDEGRPSHPLAHVPKSMRALLMARTLSALGQELKWKQFRYGPIDRSIWQRAGRVFLLAESVGLEDQPLRLYGAKSEETSITREYLRILVFHALSMGSLLPLEIELAERLMGAFIPHLTLTKRSDATSVYWADAAQPVPPTRLLRIPEPGPTRRYFGTSAAFKAIEALREEVDLSGEIPATMVLGGQYPVPAVLKVLGHLAMCCAPVPPQRHYERLPVKTRFTVVNGLEEVRARLGDGLCMQDGEAWVAEDVSRGGIGAHVALSGGDWLRVGALLGLCAEGGDNWLIGVVRRFSRETQTSGTVGIETLSRGPEPASFTRGAQSYAGLLLDPELKIDEEVRVVCAQSDWDAYATCIVRTTRDEFKLRPLALELSVDGADYVVGRYRVGPLRYEAE